MGIVLRLKLTGTDYFLLGRQWRDRRNRRDRQLGNRDRALEKWLDGGRTHRLVKYRADGPVKKRRNPNYINKLYAGQGK